MTSYIPGGPERYAHQKRGLRKILRTKGVCALLFDPGTGKTATALDFASILAYKNGGARVLVIAPLAAIDTWVDQAGVYVSPQVSYRAEALGGSIRQRVEALASRGGRPYRATKYRRGQGPTEAHQHLSLVAGERLDGGPLLEIVSVNLDTFATRQKRGSSTMADLVLDGVKRFNPDLVILDESHRIKGPGSNVSRLLARVSPLVNHRLILTGTVMPHGPLDVFAQWRFLDPYAFGDDGYTATFAQFKERYAVFGGFMGKEVRKYVNLDHMQAVMARNSLAVTKADALDLPPTTDVEVSVNLTTREWRAYEGLKQELVAVINSETEVSVPNRLSQMLRLRQVTAGHLPSPNGGLIVLGNSKVRTISSIVNDNLRGEKRIVIFEFFTHGVNAIVEALRNSGNTVEVITGKTSDRERLAIRKRFGSDDPERIVLVSQSKTISLAVNELVTANHAIFGSLSQQRDDYVQGRDRLDRIGQTRPVTFWHVVVPGTVDEVILRSHRDRTDLEQDLLRYLKEDH